MAERVCQCPQKGDEEDGGREEGRHHDSGEREDRHEEDGERDEGRHQDDGEEEHGEGRFGNPGSTGKDEQEGRESAKRTEEDQSEGHEELDGAPLASSSTLEAVAAEVEAEVDVATAVPVGVLAEDAPPAFQEQHVLRGVDAHTAPDANTAQEAHDSKHDSAGISEATADAENSAGLIAASEAASDVDPPDKKCSAETSPNGKS